MTTTDGDMAERPAAIMWGGQGNGWLGDPTFQAMVERSFSPAAYNDAAPVEAPAAASVGVDQQPEPQVTVNEVLQRLGTLGGDIPPTALQALADQIVAMSGGSAQMAEALAADARGALGDINALDPHSVEQALAQVPWIRADIAQGIRADQTAKREGEEAAMQMLGGVAAVVAGAAVGVAAGTAVLGTVGLAGTGDDESGKATAPSPFFSLISPSSLTALCLLTGDTRSEVAQAGHSWLQGAVSLDIGANRGLALADALDRGPQLAASALQAERGAAIGA